MYAAGLVDGGPLTFARLILVLRCLSAVPQALLEAAAKAATQTEPATSGPADLAKVYRLLAALFRTPGPDDTEADLDAVLDQQVADLSDGGAFHQPTASSCPGSCSWLRFGNYMEVPLAEAGLLNHLLEMTPAFAPSLQSFRSFALRHEHHLQPPVLPAAPAGSKRRRSDASASADAAVTVSAGAAAADDKAGAGETRAPERSSLANPLRVTPGLLAPIVPATVTGGLPSMPLSFPASFGVRSPGENRPLMLPEVGPHLMASGGSGRGRPPRPLPGAVEVSPLLPVRRGPGRPPPQPRSETLPPAHG